MSWLARCKYFLWLHPEWWSVAVCWLAWAVILLRSMQGSGHHGSSFATELLNWMLMVAAMMFPLVMGEVRLTALNSLWARRHLAVAEFFCGYSAPWLAVGILATALRQLPMTQTYAAAALCFAAMAVWRLTPMHARALAACHRTLPLAPLGWQADRDCLRFGSAIGRACVQTCWPLMVACAFAGHGLIAMAGGMALSAVERWSFWPRPRTVLAGTLAMACFYGALAVLDPGLASRAQERPRPEIIAATAAPFYLQGTTHVSITHRAAPEPPLEPAKRRILLNVEGITSAVWSPPYDVFLNLPLDGKPEKHPELYAGPLPMFGLVEASRPDGKQPARGLYEQLDVTDQYARVAALPGWNEKTLRVSFVPRAGKVTRVRVERVTLQANSITR